MKLEVHFDIDPNKLLLVIWTSWRPCDVIAMITYLFNALTKMASLIGCVFISIGIVYMYIYIYMIRVTFCQLRRYWFIIRYVGIAPGLFLLRLNFTGCTHVLFSAQLVSNANTGIVDKITNLVSFELLLGNDLSLMYLFPFGVWLRVENVCFRKCIPFHKNGLSYSLLLLCINLKCQYFNAYTGS